MIPRSLLVSMKLDMLIRNFQTFEDVVSSKFLDLGSMERSYSFWFLVG